MSVPAPVVAECYKPLAADSVAVASTTAAAGYPVANVLDPNLMLQYRTTDKNDFSGAAISLGVAISCYGFEALNVEHASGEDILVSLYSGVFTTVVAATSNLPTVPTEIWTGHSQLKAWQPTRANWILGVDNLATGPAPAATPIPASVSTKTALVTFKTANAARTYWELAFFALATNAKALGKANENSVKADVVRLRSGGVGFRWEITWPRLTMVDVTYLRSIQAATEGGDWPFFLWPIPGQKSAAGVISDSRYSPMTRGGLARMLSFEATEYEEVGSTQYGVDCRLSAESWQEVPIG